MPKEGEVELGNLKFGIDTEDGYYICHLFQDGEMIREVSRIHPMMLGDKEAYKLWMETLCGFYTDLMKRTVLKDVEGELRFEHSDLRKTNPGVN